MLTVFINLHLPKVDILGELYAYYRMSHEEQIDALAEAIRDAYEQAKSNHPLSEVIIAWRENGVGNRPLQINDFLSLDTKDYFFRVMENLTKENDDLTLIAGTIATDKEKPISNIKKLVNRYDENFNLLGGDRNTNQWELHKSSITSLHQIFEQNTNLNEFYNQVTNTAYFFKGGKKIGKHQKYEPHEEIDFEFQNEEMQPYAFKVGRQVGNLEINGKKILLQICKEHYTTTQSRLEFFGLNERKDVQLILSDSVPYNRDHTNAAVRIHLDTNFPALFEVDSACAAEDFCFYNYPTFGEDQDLTHGLVVPRYYNIDDKKRYFQAYLKLMPSRRKTEDFKNLIESFLDDDNNDFFFGFIQYLIEDGTGKLIQGLLNNEACSEKLLAKTYYYIFLTGQYFKNEDKFRLESKNPATFIEYFLDNKNASLDDFTQFFNEVDQAAPKNF